MENLCHCHFLAFFFGFKKPSCQTLRHGDIFSDLRIKALEFGIDQLILGESSQAEAKKVDVHGDLKP